jgi:hypothetical protein
MWRQPPKEENKMLNQQCVDIEMEYREWRESPLWVCVKTTLDALTGAVKSEIAKDDDTGLTIAIHDFDKPQDGVYETVKETIYYTYHQGFVEAQRYLAASV